MTLRVSIDKAGYAKGAILRNVNITIEHGKIGLVAGSSGSGKTTLLFSIVGILRLLGGFVEGEIYINGVNPLTERGLAEIPRLVGFLLQDPERQLIFPTPLDEILVTLQLMGLEDEVMVNKAIRILRNIGLNGKESTHIEDLSSGERRRLALAISTIHDPEYLILDEPSANLDPQGIFVIRELIKKYKNESKVVLISEHKVHYFRDLVDEVYVIQKGKLVKTDIGEELDVITRECKSSRTVSREPMVRASSVVLGYSHRIVLKEVNLDVGKGEIVTLVGPNGSGKTTLLKTIAGMLNPIEGRVEVFAKRTFYAPQNPDLVFVEPSVRKEILAVSRRTGISIDELIYRYPWYSEVWDMSPYILSHGQRRLLEVLIASAHGSELLLLDEPTTGLDPSNYSLLIKCIRKHVERGGSVLIATHDPRLVLDLADRVYVVSDGKIKEREKCEVVYEMIKNAGISSI